jgi:hypothetical protein
MDGRLPCLVPGCRHTRKAGGHPEWICHDHWALVDRRLKLRRREVSHRLRRRGELARTADSYEVLSDRAAWMMAMLWRRMKAQAIERAAGL